MDELTANFDDMDIEPGDDMMSVEDLQDLLQKCALDKKSNKQGNKQGNQATAKGGKTQGATPSARAVSGPTASAPTASASTSASTQTASLLATHYGAHLPYPPQAA